MQMATVAVCRQLHNEVLTEPWLGVLFFTEFVQGMQPLGATPDQIQAVWDAVDVDHAGSVSFDAFFSALAMLNKVCTLAFPLTLLTGLCSELRKPWISPFNTVQCENKLIQALRTCRNTVEEAFQVIDTNRNGASASRIQ